MTRVLVIDDDLELCELVSEYLEAEGFEVETTQDPEEGLRRALGGEAGLVLLDVMLPGTNGFELLRRLREQSAVAVLMLTARGDDVDRIVGLEMGADDYLAKPFNPRELVALIRAVLRRAEPGARPGAPVVLEVGDLTLDTGARSVRRGDDEVSLTGIEFDVLEQLLRSAGNVVSREDLSLTALDREYAPYDRSIDMHVSNLRRKLGPRPDDTERIKTVRGVGYVYVHPVRRGGDAADEAG